MERLGRTLVQFNNFSTERVTVVISQTRSGFEMLHEERVTYMTLKSWALECYYEGCRDHALMKGRPHEQIMGYVDYQFENVFERSVEICMWRVVLLVLSGGWHPEWSLRARQLIVDQIAAQNLQDLLADVPTDEADLFLHDLEILKLI